MGERYSDTPRSWRTSTARTLSTQSYYTAQRRTYSCIRICDKTSPHAHLTKCTDYKVYQLFRWHGKATQHGYKEDARVTRVSSKRLYPSRELNRFMRLGTMALRCLSTACGSAPAPTAVRETFSKSLRVQMIRFVTFDVLHTLITPRRPIHVQYAEVFSPYLGTLPPDAIARSFKLGVPLLSTNLYIVFARNSGNPVHF